MLPGSFFLSQMDSTWMSRATSGAQAFTRLGSRYTHTGIAVGGGLVVHAHHKRGVVCENFAELYGTREVMWSDAPIQRHLASLPDWLDVDAEETAVRRRVVDEALSLVGKGYSWLSYLSIAASEWSLPGRDRLRLAVLGRDEYMCGATVDAAYQQAGVELFDDRREAHDVTPADLHLYDERWIRERLAGLERRIAAVEERIA